MMPFVFVSGLWSGGRFCLALSTRNSTTAAFVASTESKHISVPDTLERIVNFITPYAHKGQCGLDQII